MSKIITFSRTFPSYHPRKGEATFFVEGILNCLKIDFTHDNYYAWLREWNPDIDSSFLMNFLESLTTGMGVKSHTIRDHKKPLKVGDFINPKCWAGKPYNKTDEGYWQIKFAPDIEIKKVWSFEVKDKGTFYVNNEIGLNSTVENFAKNDGLKGKDLLNWLKYPNPFKGQINCWNEKINY